MKKEAIFFQIWLRKFAPLLHLIFFVKEPKISDSLKLKIFKGMIIKFVASEPFNKQESIGLL